MSQVSPAPSAQLVRRGERLAMCCHLHDAEQFRAQRQIISCIAVRIAVLGNTGEADEENRFFPVKPFGEPALCMFYQGALAMDTERGRLTPPGALATNR